MTKHWLSGVRAPPRLWRFRAPPAAQIKMGVAGPITGPNAAFGAQPRARHDGKPVEDHQQGRRHPRPADHPRARRRRLRSEGRASRVANKFCRRRRQSSWSATSTPASRSQRPTSMRKTASCSSPRRPTNPQDHRAQAVGRVPHLRPRRPAKACCGLNMRATKLKGKKIAVVHDKTDLRQGFWADGPRSTTCTSSASRKFFMKA